MTYIPIDWVKAVARECRRRRYSGRTIKTYTYCISRFLRFADKGLDRISKKDVRLFLEHLSEKERAGNTMNVYHMAIRFLFEDVLDKRIWIDIKYSKIPEKLPVVLTKDEVKQLFNVIGNPKHRLMTELMYSAGLRVSELINLKVENLELKKGFGFVRGGKGKKDRIFILANKLKNRIRNLIETEKLEKESYLFCSNRKQKYNIRSLQQIVLRAKKMAGIDKKISCHTLRHSFATHLIENGCSVNEVQALLGHKSPETTFTYLHTASPNMIKIKSPLDKL
ncbi:tyrosine-type recombinase/integrase [Candidatus Woesearchaeota archaeon]|nr:tyrosine-type recombinase/integrase [Candidatus Woesearchaeota archaeon]